MVRNIVLPDALWQALGTFESAFRRDAIADAPVARIVDGIAALPPAEIGRAEYEIAHGADLSWYAYGNPRPRARVWLAREPSPAVLFLFHRDGFIRQAALDVLPATAVTPFVFAGLARRLNDWVEQVRTAAVGCAARLFPDLDAIIVVDAARHPRRRRASAARGSGALAHRPTSPLGRDGQQSMDVGHDL
jgi:hypothetical protein